MSELTRVVRPTRRFNARGRMMLALFEGVDRTVGRAATAVARAMRAVTSRLTTFRRNRALAP